MGGKASFLTIVWVCACLAISGSATAALSRGPAPSTEPIDPAARQLQAKLLQSLTPAEKQKLDALTQRLLPAGTRPRTTRAGSDELRREVASTFSGPDYASRQTQLSFLAAMAIADGAQQDTQELQKLKQSADQQETTLAALMQRIRERLGSETIQPRSGPRTPLPRGRTRNLGLAFTRLPPVTITLQQVNSASEAELKGIASQIDALREDVKAARNEMEEKFQAAEQARQSDYDILTSISKLVNEELDAFRKGMDK